MSSPLSRLLNAQAPVRSGILSLIKRAKIGSYPFRLSLGALERPHYAHIVFNAAQLAKRLGYSRISVIEYGVAGGLGLICLEEHAREIAKMFAIEIDVYGFDTGKGLPRPRDYRDLPYHWKEGFFAMDFDKLQKRLRKARLVLGDISETAASFFEQYRPAPIGAMAHDFDFYSSTAVALRMLAAGEEHFLPRVFCYFDDTMGSAIELYNDFTGERLAIDEFNRQNEHVKLGKPYYLLAAKRPAMWHHQIWIAHFFRHSKYNDFVSKDDQRRRI